MTESVDGVACKICGSTSHTFGRLTMLGRHSTDLHQCESCGFVQTDEPWWLEEAYADAITATDVGLLARSRTLSERIPGFLACAGALDGPVLDWGGGYGTLTRMLRDRGVDCWHADPYCQNIHARGFAAQLEDREDWAAVLAVEVLEHLEDPWKFFRAAAERTDVIVATTEVVSVPAPAPEDWWYWAPEHGQHISFYSRQALQHVGRVLGMHYVGVGRTHVWVRHAHSLGRLGMRITPVRRAVFALRKNASLMDADHREAARRLVEGAPPVSDID